MYTIQLQKHKKKSWKCRHFFFAYWGRIRTVPQEINA